MDKAQSLLDAIYWQASYGQCFGCSTRQVSVPADYEVWFTTFGEMVSEDYPPESCCHTLCIDCTAHARADSAPGNPGGMVVVMVRPVRLTTQDSE